MGFMTAKPKDNSPKEEIPTAHWADRVAEELLQMHPGRGKFVCASGISPSGVVHIGNFREVITVDFVVRALRDRGKDVRFIYSWDDYDAFRKVPANLPNKPLLESNLRKPISQVPDPYGENPSYAGRFEKIFEGEIEQLGIRPDYIRQNEPYRACLYAPGIREALKNEKIIAEILNRSRTEPLPADWSCVSVFCSGCGKDTTEVTKYTPPSSIAYRCESCGDRQVDFEKEGGVKLLWRVDWPMRWAREGVDFEPGGKDHSSQGGSFDTGAEIIRAVWKCEPPHYLQYDFVLAKGLGSKLSSSSGNLITLGEALEIYEPVVVRWIFASRKPNMDFSIAFDLDVMKAYDDFDRCERYAYGVEEGEEKKVNYERRIFELSLLDPKARGTYGELPAQFPFRHLCNILQINEGDFGKTQAFYEPILKSKQDRERFLSRAQRAWKWITTFAPEDFKFRLRPEGEAMPKTKQAGAVRDVVEYLRDLSEVSEEKITDHMRGIMKEHGLEPKAFFQELYSLLINKAHGPKLASFFLAIGPKRAAEILEKSL